MVREPKQYFDRFDYVKVKSNKRFNIDRREWTCGRNFPLEEGEVAVVARNGRGMRFFLENGFLEVIDHEPRDSTDRSVTCGVCGDEFDSERGLASHRRQVHNQDNDDDVDGGE